MYYHKPWQENHVTRTFKRYNCHFKTILQQILLFGRAEATKTSIAIFLCQYANKVAVVANSPKIIAFSRFFPPGLKLRPLGNNLKQGEYRA